MNMYEVTRDEALFRVDYRNGTRLICYMVKTKSASAKVTTLENSKQLAVKIKPSKGQEVFLETKTCCRLVLRTGGHHIEKIDHKNSYVHT